MEFVGAMFAGFAMIAISAAVLFAAALVADCFGRKKED